MFNRYVALVFALIFLACIGCFAQGVVVPNTSFENGNYSISNIPDGWKISLGGTAKYFWDENGYKGRCLSLENMGNEDQGMATSDNFSIKPYHNYRLSFWHKTKEPNDRYVEVWIYYGEYNGIDGCRNFTVTTTREWQQRIVEFTSPGISETYIRFVMSSHSENSKVYIDEIKLEDLGTAKVNPETIDWKLDDTSVLKNAGGLFTKIDGPKTSRPIISVVPLSSLKVVNTGAPITPVVDGMISDVEYVPFTATIGPLRALSDGQATKDKTYTYVTYDNQNLYVAWKCTYKGDAPITATRPDVRDGGRPNLDDSVEVLLQPNSNSLYHLLLTANGAIYDEKLDYSKNQTDSDWNSKLDYKTSMKSGIWYGEMSIPWSDFGLSAPPTPNDNTFIDICRTSPTYSEQSKWCWLNEVAGFVNKDYLGKVIFDSSGWTFNLDNLTSKVGANNVIMYVSTSAQRTGSLIWCLKVFDETGKLISRNANIMTPRRGDILYWPFEYDLPNEGTYTLAIDIQDPQTGKEIYNFTIPIDSKLDFQIESKILPFRERLIVNADLSQAGIKDDLANKMIVQLNRDGKDIGKFEALRAEFNLYKGDFSLKGYKSGNYTADFSIVDSLGRFLISAQRELIIPTKPVWYGNKIAKNNKIITPFKPVKAKGLSVDVWNRSYEFANSGLPKEIITSGSNILSSEVNAVLKSGGKKVSLNTGNAKIVSSTDESAVVKSVPAKSGGVRFWADTTTEFDGMMKINFTIDPGKNPIDVDSFTINFPLNQKNAIYLDAPVMAPPFHHLIDKDGWKMNRSLSDGTAEVWGRFWIGDDDRGMDFCFLSDEGWKPYDRPDFIQIKRVGSVVNVDINILGKTLLNKPLSGTLLVTATPVRPIAKDYQHDNLILWDGRPMKVVEGIDTYGSDNIGKFADYGVNMVMLSDHWANGYGRPEPFDKLNFGKLVKRAKRSKIKVVLYMGGLNGCWAERGAEAPYLAEWEQEPAFKSANGGRPDQALTSVCMTDSNGGHDCLIYLLDKLISEYDIDGVYVDGSGWFPTKSLINGFGYIDDNGKVRPTNTILETRKLFKRVSRLFMEHGKQPIILHHCSWMLAAPVDSFTDLHVAGEYLAYKANDSTDFPTDYLKIECSGIQWGVPVYLLCYNTSLWQRYLANTFIYGSQPESGISSFSLPNYFLESISKIWTGFKGFDLKSSEWVPFWKAGNSVTTDNPDCKVSYYKNQKQGLLLLVGNTKRNPGNAKISLNMKSLGLSGKKIQVKAANNPDMKFSYQDNTINVPLFGDDCLMFYVSYD